MDEREKLHSALAALDPSGLDYAQWTMVGMALKEAGEAPEVWDSWSARDPARYHPGECGRKWATFAGSATPVTAASIFDLARRTGWRGYDGGHALDWDSVIAADGVLVGPGWAEDEDFSIPDDWDPADQMVRYLQALFQPDENVGYVTEVFQRTAKDGGTRWVPSRGCWDRTAGQLIAALLDCGGDVGRVIGDTQPGTGAWIRFNPLDGQGCKNENVTEYRFALVECDTLELAKQNALIRQLELPCAALVYSGKKSLHAIVRIDAANAAEYKRRVEYLYAVCKKNGLVLDEQNKNPSRLSRLPGVMRGGQKQYLLATNIGRASFAEWKAFIEESSDELPEFESLAEVWDALPPLAEPLIEGVLRKGHKLLLAGPSKAGKSFALIELCIAIAEGLCWLGRFACAKGRVLYVNLELDRASCLHRIRDVYNALGAPPANLGSIDLWNLRGASSPMDKLTPSLVRRAAKRGYAAVVIDPIYKVITGDENSADQMARFCNQFDRLARELGCAVIYCHHHSKGAQGGKRSMDRASGSGVFARDPDAMLDLIQLELTDGAREWAANKAECTTRLAALESAGQAGGEDPPRGGRTLGGAGIGPDEAQSPVQLARACAQLLSAAECAALDGRVTAARRRAAALTGWRIEGTLREFARFEPVDLWFDYPVHRFDESGVLADQQPEGEGVGYAARKLGRGRWKGKSNEERKKERAASLGTAFDACASLGEGVTVYALAEYMGVGERTVRNRLKEAGSYWMDGERVGRRAQGTAVRETEK